MFILIGTLLGIFASSGKIGIINKRHTKFDNEKNLYNIFTMAFVCGTYSLFYIVINLLLETKMKYIVMCYWIFLYSIYNYYEEND